MRALMLIPVVATTIFLVQGCEREGIFPGSTSNSFVVCSMVNGDLIRSEHFCSGERIFSLTDKSCVNPGQLIRSYLLPERDTDTDVELVCTKPGASCKSCKVIQICIGMPGAGIFNVQEVGKITCKDGQLCQVGKGCVSTTDENAFCSYRNFRCTDVGIYPDPYDCTKYYYCNPAGNGVINRIPRSCGSQSSFSATTGSCGYPLNSDECYNRVVPVCSKEFQLGAVTNNIYYICIKVGDIIGPDLYSCKSGLSFNTTTLSCE